jgi:hypothetical protein
LETQQQTQTAVAEPSRRRHNIVTGLAAATACLLIVLTIVATWTYATLLNTDRFVGTVGAVTSDPAVITSVSQRVARQVVDGFEVQFRLEELLPDRLDPLAGKFADSLQDGIANRLEQALSSERFTNLWTAALTGVHQRLLALLRGDAPNAELANGVLTIDMLGVISDAVAQLQADGVIDHQFTLPPWAGDGDRQATIDVLNRELNITLPAEFGKVELTNVAWLETASTVVRAFDVAVLLLILLSIALTTLAVWLAERRKRAILYMAVAIELVLLLLGLTAGVVGGPVLADIAERQSLAIVAVMGSVLAGSLMGWLAAFALAVAVVGLVALFVVPNRAVASHS